LFVHAAKYPGQGFPGQTNFLGGKREWPQVKAGGGAVQACICSWAEPVDQEMGDPGIRRGLVAETTLFSGAFKMAGKDFEDISAESMVCSEGGAKFFCLPA